MALAVTGHTTSTCEITWISPSIRCARLAWPASIFGGRRGRRGSGDGGDRRGLDTHGGVGGRAELATVGRGDCGAAWRRASGIVAHSVLGNFSRYLKTCKSPGFANDVILARGTNVAVAAPSLDFPPATYSQEICLATMRIGLDDEPILVLDPSSRTPHHPTPRGTGLLCLPNRKRNLIRLFPSR